MKAAILAGVAAFAVTAATLAFAQPGASGAMHSHMQMPTTKAEVTTMVRTRFTEADKNRDGFITKDELQAAMTARMAERHAKMFDRMDSDHNGQISRQEFDAFHSTRMEAAGGMQGKKGMGDMHQGGMHKGGMGFGTRMFDMADANKDGRLSLKEATDAALKHFDMVDANHDGTISPQERQQMRERMHQMRTQMKAS